MARRTTAAAPAPNMQYQGGPVIASAQVENVLWGPGTYPAAVTGATPAIGTATTDQLNSEWSAGLSEYSLGSQRIGPGRAIGSVSIAPANSAVDINASDIPTELARQLSTNGIPQPTFDSTGTAQTVYAVFFPSGTTICDPTAPTVNGAEACSTNAFCAYHDSFVANVGGVDRLIPYVVMPDPTVSTYKDGCADTGESTLQAMEKVESHELAETITDPYVGWQTSQGQDLAGWVDPNYDEVGDICQSDPNRSWTPPDDSVNYTDGSGNPYTTQAVWSNQYHHCMPTYPSAPLGLSARAVVGGHLRLAWSVPLDDRRAPIQGYDVFVETPAGYKWVGSTEQLSWTSPAYPYGQRKTFLVDAWNNTNGEQDGNDSNTATVTTASTPGAVPWLRLVRHGSSPFLEWGAADPQGSAITAYVLSGFGPGITTKGSTRGISLKNAKPGRYVLTLRARNSLGIGSARTITFVIR